MVPDETLIIGRQLMEKTEPFPKEMIGTGFIPDRCLYLQENN